MSFTGAGSDLNGSVSTYSWVFPGESNRFSNAQDPGAVAFPAAGVYTVSLTVVDDVGENDPTPATRTITVKP